MSIVDQTLVSGFSLTKVSLNNQKALLHLTSD